MSKRYVYATAFFIIAFHAMTIATNACHHAIICTNECEATTDHETITENIEIGKEVLVNDREFGLVLGSRIFIGPYLNEPRHLY